jgi:PKD repeat protein
VQTAFGGWTNATPASSIKTLNSIWGTSATNIYAVGLDGTILHYNGSDWIPENSGTTNRLNAIWGSSETNIYAVGDSVILHKTGSGTTWESVSLIDYKDPDINWTDLIFVSIRGADSNHIYAGIDTGSLIYFDGTGWTSTDFPGYALQVSGIWPFTSSNIYLSRGGGAISHYDGTYWASVYSGNEQSSFKAIWANSPSDIYVVGNSGEIIRCAGNCTEEAGWQLITPSVVAQNLNSVYGSSGSNIIAVGSQGTIVHNKGAGFIATPFSTLNDLFGVWVSPDGSAAYAVGTDGMILKWVPDPVTTTTTIPGSTTTTSIGGGTTTTTIPVGTTTTTVSGSTTTIPGNVTTTTVPPGEVGADFIGSPLKGKVPLPVQFTNLSGGTITSYQWTFGDGGASTEKNPSHVYTKPGTYTVILTVIGGDNNSKTATKTRESYITVKSKCAIAASIANRQQIKAMRAVRDANLSDLSGALLTAIYYRNVTEISALFDEHPELSNRFRELVQEHSDVLENLLQGQDATVSPAAVADVIDYLEDLKAKSSIMFQYNINFIILGIENGFLLNGLGITIK